MIRHIFGSDLLKPYTAEYTWLANQMAHAMMGFALQICWTLFVLVKSAPAWTDVLVLTPFAALVLKEVVDVVFDWRGYRSSPVRTYLSEPILDSASDLVYWFGGMVLALGVLAWSDALTHWLGMTNLAYRAGLPAPLLAGFGVVGFLVMRVWVRQKRHFDRSNLPSAYSRLLPMSATWTAEPPFLEPEQAFDALREFQQDVRADRTRHYVIVGGKPALRSRLAVAMGCEAVLRFPPAREPRRPVVAYTTGTRLLDDPGSVLDDPPTQWIVIDDLDVASHTASRGVAASPHAESPHHDEPAWLAGVRSKVHENSVGTIWTLARTNDSHLEQVQALIDRLLGSEGQIVVLMLRD